jgi:hypothetical protein
MTLHGGIAWTQRISWENCFSCTCGLLLISFLMTENDIDGRTFLDFNESDLKDLWSSFKLRKEIRKYLEKLVILYLRRAFTHVWSFQLQALISIYALLEFWAFVLHSKYLNHFIDWLIVYSFTSRSRIFHLYGDVTIASEGLQNLGLCSALRAFEQGGIFFVPHLLWHGASVFPVSSEGPSHLVAFYDTRGDVEDLF